MVLDGQFINSPLWINGNWWVVEGVNAKNGNTSVVAFNHTSNSTIQRVVAWDSNWTKSTTIFVNEAGGGSTLATANRVIDSAFFGQGSIICDNHGGGYLYMRRVYCRNDGSQNDNAGHESFNLSYGTGPAMCDNCLATWFESYPTSWRITQQGSDISAGTGGCTGPAGSTCEPASPGNANCGGKTGIITEPYCYETVWRSRSNLQPTATVPTFLNGSIIWIPTTTTYSGGKGIITMDGAVSTINDRHIKHTLSYYPPGLLRRGTGGLPAASLTAMHLRSNGGGTSDADHVTTISATNDSVSSGWTVTNGSHVTSLGSAPNPWTNSGAGANLCKRWEDGVVTTTPLWPWPMNERIKQASILAGTYQGPCLDCTGSFNSRPTIDVTAEMESIFGAIPSECRNDVTPPPTFPEATGFPVNPVFDTFDAFSGYTTLSGNGWQASGGQATPISGFSVVRRNDQFSVDQEVYGQISTLPSAGGPGLATNGRMVDNSNKLRATLAVVAGTNNDTVQLDQVTGGSTAITTGAISLGFDAAVNDSIGIRAIGSGADIVYRRTTEGVWRTIGSIAGVPTAQGSIGMASADGGFTSLGGGSLSVQVPVLAVEPSSLSFSGAVGSNPASQSITISDTAGTGTMSWTCGTNAAWVSCSPSSGTGNAQATISIDTSGLSSGNHNATVTVTAPESTVTADTVSVSLSLSPTSTPSHRRGGRIR